MIDGDITRFIDQLYYGQEIVFLYKGKKYFIQGWYDQDKKTATMVLEDVNEQQFTGYLWECHADKMDQCANAFLFGLEKFGWNEKGGLPNVPVNIFCYAILLNHPLWKLFQVYLLSL